MVLAEQYELHMLSFRRKGETSACNVAFGNGENLQPWHIDAVKQWLVAHRGPFDDGSDLV